MINIRRIDDAYSPKNVIIEGEESKFQEEDFQFESVQSYKKRTRTQSENLGYSFLSFIDKKLLNNK